MNSKIIKAVLLAVLILVSVGLYAQLVMIKKEEERPRLPPWVSDKGYWVVESNGSSPRRCTILFYNNENVLMHKEIVEGIRLNAEKRKVKMKLKKALEFSALAWDKTEKGMIPAAAGESSLVMHFLR